MVLGFAALVVATALSVPGAAPPAPGAEPDRAKALYAWRFALERFQRAGVLVGREQFQAAHQILTESQTQLDPPYAGKARIFRHQLDGALGQSDVLNGYYRLGELGKVCMDLNAHEEAAAFSVRARRAHPRDHHGHALRIPYCLYESGAVEEGLAAYRELLAHFQAQAWLTNTLAGLCEKRISLLEARPANLQNASFSLRLVREHYARNPRNFKDDFGALRELAHALSHARQEAVRLQIYRQIAESLGNLRDEAGRTAWEEKLLRDFAHDSDACVAVHIGRAQRAYKARRLGDALMLYRKVCADYADSRLYGAACWNVGLILSELRRYDEAIVEFSRLLQSNVNDLEPGTHIMQPYQNYRPNAAWQIGLCRLAMKQPEQALAAFRETRDKYPFRSWCGNENWWFTYRHFAFEGLCLEHMGRHRDAVRAYCRALTESYDRHPFVPRRLADLYEAADETGRLLALCDTLDAQRYGEDAFHGTERQAAIRRSMAPSTLLRRVLAIRADARVGRLPAVADLLQRRHLATGPYTSHALRTNWVADEAARTLAKYPRRTLDLLMQRATHGTNNDLGWVHYALGLGGQPEAVALLAQRLREETNCWERLTLTFALTQAGPRGRAALDAIDASFATQLATYQRHYPAPFPEPPPIPASLELPLRPSGLTD